MFICVFNYVANSFGAIVDHFYHICFCCHFMPDFIQYLLTKQLPRLFFFLSVYHSNVCRFSKSIKIDRRPFSRPVGFSLLCIIGLHRDIVCFTYWHILATRERAHVLNLFPRIILINAFFLSFSLVRICLFIIIGVFFCWKQNTTCLNLTLCYNMCHSMWRRMKSAVVNSSGEFDIISKGICTKCYSKILVLW